MEIRDPYAATDIAQWFINRAACDVGAKGGEYLTHLKLQKLLYYAQGCYLAVEGRPLFNDKIYCWTHGPVVFNVYHEFKQYGDKIIDEVSPINIDDHTGSILEQVYDIFGAYSALKLREMTHNEAPWKNTEKDKEISLDLIQSYFIEHYITD